MTQHTTLSPEATWIDAPTTLEDWLQQVADGDLLGLDTEFMRRNTFRPHLSLLQLRHHDRRALVDPLAFHMGDALERHLGQRPVTCVMHSAGEDLEALSPWLPHGPARLFDTQLAAAFGGAPLGMSYRALVAQYCDVELDKGETRSDWQRRPLSASQKRYAVLDVEYLQPLHDALSERLRARGRMAWFDADCRHLKQRADTDALPDQPQQELHAAATWSHARQAMLRRILLWRERVARSIDKPRNWLVDKEHALDLAAHPPSNMDQLFQATRGQRALRGRQRQQLLELLQSPPDDTEIKATAAIAGRPRRDAKAALQQMKQVVEAVATELDLPVGLLFPRKHLETIHATGRWPAKTSDWRREVLETPLQPWLSESVDQASQRT